MKLLLDSHIIIALVDGKLQQRYPRIARVIETEKPELFVSIASIWELAIKTRLKKLDLRIPVADAPSYLAELGILLLDLSPAHATSDIEPDVATRDPFDRLLLAQAQIEGMRFMTVDRALIDHPVTFR